MSIEEFEEKERSRFNFNLEEFGMLLLANWHWFIIAIIITTSIGVFKI